MSDQNMNTCTYKQGKIGQCCMPLAAAYIPFQGENAQKYESSEALTRGTLFPGLDLPFLDSVNKSNPYAGTPLGELMAIDFVVKELNLYLDTHSEDTEAFQLMKKMLVLSRKAREKYVKKFGPICLKDLEDSETYDWLTGPWPWEFCERRMDD